MPLIVTRLTVLGRSPDEDAPLQGDVAFSDGLTYSFSRSSVREPWSFGRLFAGHRGVPQAFVACPSRATALDTHLSSLLHADLLDAA